jgi:hypothetical protein
MHAVARSIARSGTHAFARTCLRLALGPFSLGLALSASLTACGGSSAPAEYPDVKVAARSLTLTLTDSRKKWTDPITEMETLDRTQSNTYAQKLPSDTEQQLRARLVRVTGGKGPELQISAEVRRGDVTFYNDSRGDFARYDVALGFRVTTRSGALLDKGKGGAWREIPSDQADSKTLARTFAEATIAAMDQYWASEETLEKINEQLTRYLQTHPDER